MQKPLKPQNEDQRIASLKQLEILDTPAEERFDRITRVAKRSLGTSIALISLIDSERQWFKSAQGFLARETPRDISFCGHAILGEGPFVVPDASRDERFADNPLVTGEPRIRFYAGQPIRSPDGQRIGTLCVIEHEARDLDPEERLLLADLAAIVEDQLRLQALSQSEMALRQRLSESERRAAIDPLTRVWNREAIFKLLEMEVERADRQGEEFSVAMLDIDPGALRRGRDECHYEPRRLCAASRSRSWQERGGSRG